MMTELNSKVVIVTGGATLIGAAVVEGLRACGARVAVFDIDAQRGAQVAAQSPQTTRFWPVDISHDAQLEQGVQEVVAHFGRLDGLAQVASQVAAEVSLVEPGHGRPASPEPHPSDAMVRASSAFNEQGFLTLDVRGAAGRLMAQGGASAALSSPSPTEPGPAPVASLTGGGRAIHLALDQAERELLKEALARSGGNYSAAARLLKISRAKLAYRARKHQL